MKKDLCLTKSKMVNTGFLQSALMLQLILMGNAKAQNISESGAKSKQDRISAFRMRIQSYLHEHKNRTKINHEAVRLQCYSCHSAITNEECNENGRVTCLPTQTSCQTEIRVFSPLNGVTARIRKGCKQEKACTKNFLPNKNQEGASTQCNYMPKTSRSICRYCCAEPGCNQEIPYHTCGQVPVPEYGSASCEQNNLHASVCTFECEPCHTLTGSTVRMCLGSERWSGHETKCTYDYNLPGCTSPFNCPADVVRPPENGNVECSDGNRFGSECRFICESGFFLAGKRVLRCSAATNKWDANRPRCIRGDDSSNPCHIYAVFEFLPNGQLLCDCSTGFSGDGFIDCHDVNECEDETDVCDDNADCINTQGSYRCQCRPGYRGSGAECGDVNECSMATDDCDPDHGVCVNNDGSYACVCSPEYVGDGRTCTKVTIACPGSLIGDICLPESDSLNDAPMPLVEIPAKNPTEATAVSSFFSYSKQLDPCVRMTEGRPAIVRESSEYELVNDRLLRKIVETSNNTRIVLGPWIGLDDRYEPGVLRWRDGKRLEKTDFQAWAPGQPKIVDSNGFGNCVNMISDPVGTYTNTFLWQITLCSQPTRYICESEKSDEPAVALCFPLVDVANGRMSCTNGWRSGSTCFYSCNSGYVLRGNSAKVTCEETNMVWDNEPPVCVRAVCTQTLMPPNSGTMACTNGNKEYSKCTFSCKPEFTLHGNRTVTCQRNLKWSSQRPCCRDDCPPYARMNLILVLDSSRSISAENFQLIKTFAKRLHRRFEVSEDFTHVSVITYSSDIKLLNNITSFTSSEMLDVALDELPYVGEGTLIGKAIKYVTRNLAGRRSSAGDVVVVLTDGISHDDVYFPSKELRATGAHVVAVGVRHAWTYQLHMIASEPTDVNVVEVETYNDLNHTVGVIGKKVCHLSC